VACFDRNLSEVVVLCCISPPFGGLSTTRGEMTYVLLTRAPLYRGRSPFSHDLHVLGAPLTFVLSQDQTLQLDPSASSTGLAVEPPFGSLSSNTLVLIRGERDERFLSTHAISRGAMDSVFKDRGEKLLLPARGAEPSPTSRVCQREI
jgi:hypothetical protein